MTRLLTTAVACLLAAPLAAGAQIIRTLDAAPGGRLVVETEGGAIEVRPGSGGAVRVEIRRDGDTADAILEDFDVTFTSEAGEVRLDIDALDTRRRFFGRREALDIVVDAPPAFDLDLRTSGGPVAVGDFRGDVRARTSGGSVAVGAIDGPVQARTSGGSVSVDSATELDISSSGGSLHVGAVTGAVRARSSGGSISIDRARAVDARTSGGGITIDRVTEAVEARSSGGGIRVTFDASPARDSRLTTSGGGVTVIVPSDAAFTLDARGNGVRTDLPLDGGGGRSDRNRLQGEVNGGGPVLELRSSGGRALIETR